MLKTVVMLSGFEAWRGGLYDMPVYEPLGSARAAYFESAQNDNLALP